MEQQNRDLQRVKIPIGIVHRKSNQSKIINNSLYLYTNKFQEQENLYNNVSTNSALVNFCSNSYSKVKRKNGNETSTTSWNAKILTIDADFKMKKCQRKQHDDENLVLKDSTITRDIGPRVEIINGKIVLKESSLMIANQESAIVEGEYEEVEEGIHASSRYSSFSNKRKSVNWTIEETRDFYKAVQQCGTEFSVMEAFFPNRTRKELKKKFFREENQHPELIKRALDSSIPLELKTFEEKFGEKLLSEEDDIETI